MHPLWSNTDPGLERVRKEEIKKGRITEGFIQWPWTASAHIKIVKLKYSAFKPPRGNYSFRAKGGHLVKWPLLRADPQGHCSLWLLLTISSVRLWGFCPWFQPLGSGLNRSVHWPADHWPAGPYRASVPMPHLSFSLHHQSRKHQWPRSHTAQGFFVYHLSFPFVKGINLSSAQSYETVLGRLS